MYVRPSHHVIFIDAHQAVVFTSATTPQSTSLVDFDPQVTNLDLSTMFADVRPLREVEAIIFRGPRGEVENFTHWLRMKHRQRSPFFRLPQLMQCVRDYKLLDVYVVTPDEVILIKQRADGHVDWTLHAREIEFWQGSTTALAKVQQVHKACPEKIHRASPFGGSTRVLTHQPIAPPVAEPPVPTDRYATPLGLDYQADILRLHLLCNCMNATYVVGATASHCTTRTEVTLQLEGTTLLYLEDCWLSTGLREAYALLAERSTPEILAQVERSVSKCMMAMRTNPT
jgi:hypothetical protein